MLVLNGLIKKRLALGKSILLCFVDFPKAFDVINHNMLFYKLMGEKVIDTLRSLYDNSHFRFKRHEPNHSQPGWGKSGRYLNWLAVSWIHGRRGRLLKQPPWHCHLRWNFCSLTVGGLFDSNFRYHRGGQSLLNGLEKFCSNNQMIVNETKTKALCFVWRKT